MSRTYKDRPYKLHSSYWRSDEEEYIPCGNPMFPWAVMKKKTSKPKKRKEVDTEWHWMSTPSWWTRLTMNRPQRRAGHTWETGVIGLQFIDETLDYPGVGKRPHNYFW